METKKNVDKIMKDDYKGGKGFKRLSKKAVPKGMDSCPDCGMKPCVCGGK